MSRRATLARDLPWLLGLLGFLAAVGGVVYLEAWRSSPQPRALPTAPGFGAFQPIATPAGPTAVAPREGARTPSFTAKRFNGGMLSLADLRGKGVVMNFFASWCAPCRAEARELEGTYQKYRQQGIVFLGVDIETDTWEDARDFLKEFGITYPAIRDEDGSIARTYQMYGLPTTYFIDKDGIVRSKFVGAFLGPNGLRELEVRIKLILP